MKRLSLLLTMILFSLSFPTWAQDTATIVGAVTDATGAVIPGAKVTVSNPLKGYTRELIASSAGEYTAYKIPIGEYVVTAQAPGFQKLVRSGITLSVGQTLRVDLQMTLGQVTQEVTVTGNVARVETETSAISDVVTAQQIANLELNGRNFLGLYLLVPGAMPDDSFDQTKIGIEGFAGVSFNGNRMEYNNIEIDGGNNADEGSGGVSVNTFPILDSIAEFRVSTSNYGADMGRHAGAQIEVATKSGTRNFHGDAFDYVRNDKFDGNDWFVNRTPWSSLDVNANCHGNPSGPCNAPKTPLKWNDYGYTFGGPFYIPGHYNTDKTKTFFFWSEDWRKYREGTVISGGVPSLLQRTGNFSECDLASPLYNAVVASGCVIPTDPTTGMPTDSVAVDPNAATLLNAYVPLPNSGPVSYIHAASTPINWREEQIRVDQNISDKASVFLRFTSDAWNTNWATEQWSWSNFDSSQTQFFGPAKSAALHITENFKPNLMNEFIMGYTVDHIRLYPVVGAASLSHSLNKPANWGANNLFPTNAANPLLPAIVVCGGGPCFGEDSGNLPWFNSNPVITWKDNIAWTRGAHTLKFGVYLAKYRKNEQFGWDTQGSMYFDTWGSNTTGNALADLYLGRIQQYTEGTMTVNGVPVGGYPKGHWRSTDLEPYFQDDWKVSRKLTLNLGVRYYYFVPVHDVSRPQTVDSGFLPGLYNPANEAQLDANGNLIPATGHIYTTFGNGLVQCGANGIAHGCRLPSYWTASPRVGFAFDPTGSGKTSIRGGYGLFYEPGNGNESNTEGGEGDPPVSLSPSGFNINGFNQIVPGAIGPTGFTAIPYHEKWGNIQQYSMSIQHEFPGNNLLSVAYVGTLGRHLARGRQLDQVLLGLKTINVPALASFQGTDSLNPSNTTPMCDAAGNCDVQRILINNQQPSIFFAPYRGYNAINLKENTAVSSYNGLQFNYRHAFGHGLTFQTAYTWSHNLDDASSTYFQSGVDDYHLSRWKDTSNLNRTHVLVMNYIYELPFFQHAGRSVVRQTLGGWRVSGITSFYTGQPVDIGCGVQGFSTGIGASLRCNPVAKLRIKKGMDNDPTYGPTPTWFDPNTYTQPDASQLWANGEAGMFGYMGRNTLTGPGVNNWDLAMHKDIRLPWFGGEHSTIQFRWETFNSFNHPQWKGVNAGCGGQPDDGFDLNGVPSAAFANGTPAFGRPCGGHHYNLGNGQVSGARAPRIMQLALKFMF